MDSRANGLRGRILAVVFSGLVLALPATALAGKPEATQSANLTIEGCNARVVADWANQPGRYKTYQVRLMNDLTGTLYSAADGSSRAGHVDTVVRMIAGETRNFRVALWFFDRDGVVVGAALSGWVSAACQ